MRGSDAESDICSDKDLQSASQDSIIPLVLSTVATPVLSPAFTIVFSTVVSPVVTPIVSTVVTEALASDDFRHAFAEIQIHIDELTRRGTTSETRDYQFKEVDLIQDIEENQI